MYPYVFEQIDKGWFDCANCERWIRLRACFFPKCKANIMICLTFKTKFVNLNEVLNEWGTINDVIQFLAFYIEFLCYWLNHVCIEYYYVLFFLLL